MPWNHQNSGWQGGGGGRGPWGQGPTGGGQGGGGHGGSGGDGQGPDLEELLRRSQDRFRRAMPGGGMGPMAIVLLILVAIVGYAATGIYRVQNAELGVVTTFGDFTGNLTGPGLRYHIPWPVQSVQVVDVNQIQTTSIGAVTSGPQRGISNESLMLTGDENIVDMRFSVQWQVADPAAFLFNIQDPEETVKAISESVMREVVGRTNFQDVLNVRGPIEGEVRDSVQAILDSYRSGIRAVQVNMAAVDPPANVIDDYRDVQRARTDQERFQNEAEAYRNRIVPEARGEAQRILQDAQAYRDRVIAEAQGESQRFIKVYNEYAKAEDVTRQRIYLETLEEVLGGADKIIIEGETGQGVLPYLPLPELNRRQGGSTGEPAPAAAAQGGQQ